MRMIHEALAEWLGSNIDGLDYSLTDDTGNLFIDYAPSKPDRAVTLYTAPGTEADSKLPYDPVAFQVVVRDTAGSEWGTRMWEAIYDALHGKRNLEIPGSGSGDEPLLIIYIIGTQSSPFRLSPDTNGRPLLSANYRAEILNPTSQRPA